MRYGHIKPDMTLTKPERDADRAAWKALEAENKRLRDAALHAIQIIDTNLHHQREKVWDASAILKTALLPPDQ